VSFAILLLRLLRLRLLLAQAQPMPAAATNAAWQQVPAWPAALSRLTSWHGAPCPSLVPAGLPLQLVPLMP
jgi:hypothetical protein